MKRCPLCGAEYPDDSKFCPNDGGTLKPAVAAIDLVGQIIADRYHILRKLGEGGMGQVYLAEHVKMGRPSAIKVMGAGMAADADAVSRFNREAANASRIAHSNVCAIYDFGEHDGLIYLAMEYIEGRTLSDLLTESGPLPLPRASAILTQCADALQAAHDLGIVHRDLKPDNIMIVAAKGRDVVKVVDFGIAKTMDGKKDGQAVTKTGLVVGTPEYMSPEQLVGDPLDGRSDLYSLALVFYKMLTANLPFQGTSGQETLLKRITDEPAPLAQVRPDLAFPPALQAALNRALSRWPKDRYAGPADFAKEVASIARNSGAAAAVTRTLPSEAATRVQAPVSGGSVKTVQTTVVTPAHEGGANGKRIGAVVAAGVAVLAATGFLLRGQLFGTKEKAANPRADSVASAPHDTSGSKFVGTPQDSVKTQAANPTTPRPRTTSPTGSADPATPAPQAPADEAALKRQLDSIDPEIVERRLENRKAAMAIYNRTDLSPRLRSEAARVVSQLYFEDSDIDPARTWIGRAIALDANPRYQTFKSLLDAQAK